MDLSPGEEHAFATLVSQLERRRSGIPWSIVVASVVLVGLVVVAALPLGLHHHLASLFYGTFLLALVGGLALVALLNRRAGPGGRRSRPRRNRSRGRP